MVISYLEFIFTILLFLTVIIDKNYSDNDKLMN